VTGDRTPDATPDRPLAGLTVVITRPVDQAPALAALLEAAGAHAVVMPLIDLADVASDDEIRTALAGLGANDWVVATSAHAARRIGPVLGECPARVAAVGATTAATLPRVDLVAEQQSAEGLVALFPSGDGRVIVAQAEEGAATMVDGARALGWRADRLHTHRSVAVVPTAQQQLTVLAADAVVFTSGTQADAWVNIFGTTTPPIVATIGPQTTRKTERAGIKVQVTAADHSLSGVVRAMEGFLQRS
jgi:uroporphyrinogen-III synthase